MRLFRSAEMKETRVSVGKISFMVIVTIIYGD